LDSNPSEEFKVPVFTYYDFSVENLSREKPSLKPIKVKKEDLKYLTTMK
jgi:hypothetical protein